MSAETYGSLAELFKKDSQAKEAYRQQNPTSKIVHNYIFSSELVRDEVNKCATGNNCQWFSASEESRRQENLKKMVLCITCDNIYHLRCTGIDFTKAQEKHLPWMCSLCMNNTMNSAAQELVTSGKYKQSFDERIKYFIKGSDAAEESDSDSISSNINETVHVDRKGNRISKSILSELNKVREENKVLQQQLLESTKLVAEFLKNQSNATINANQLQNEIPQVTVDSILCLQETDYSNAILNANGASTRINDELEQSQSAINAMIGNSNDNGDIPAVSADIKRAESTENAVDNTLRHLSKLTISELRRNLPKIEKFDGSPEKWLTFQRAVERNWKEGEYTSNEMRNQIRNALTGLALARIDSLFPLLSAEKIMSALKESFGNSNVVVESAKLKLMNAKLSRPLTHASCVEVTTYIASYMAACSYAGILITDSSISSRIHNQLEPYHQQMYYDFYFKKLPNAATRMERLDIQFEFLNSLSKTLPLGSFNKSEDSKAKIKGNNYQLMTALTSSNTQKYQASNHNDGYKYEIKDKETARYLGYDMDKVRQIPKRCEICMKTNHYSVECNIYRDMKMDAKYNAVKTKNICMNCLLTSSHQTKDCDIKNGCGFKIDKNARCSGKHHVTLHRGNGSINSNYNKSFKRQNRRSNTNSNAARANAKVEDYQQNLAHQQVENNTQQVLGCIVSTEVSTNNIPQVNVTQGYPVKPPITNEDSCKPYQTFLTSPIVCTPNESSYRTVKLFKTIFYGNKNNAIGYAMGDSAAEISLVKKELIDDLGIAGAKCTIELQWTDAKVKIVDAWKVKLKLSGIGHAKEVYELDECYAVQDLNLPPRTLNVEALKKQFPHLRQVPFSSYEDAIPTILLGSTHAYMFEAIEPVIEDGKNKPVAMKSKLGYTIYGGAIEKFQLSYSINAHQMKDGESSSESQISNDELERLYTYACSIENLGIKPHHTHYTKDEKQAVKLLEKEMKILPSGSVEVPLVWNLVDEEIPSLPDNFPMAYKRQIATENNLNKSPEMLEAYNKNFEELIKENYVRPATDRDMNYEWPNKWYIPMSLVVNKNKEPIKMRNVYDASARYKGTSLNDMLLMGPNLLVDMIQPLMRMRMYKYAFTADVKSMFHRIFICERDQQCQRILWRPNQSDPMQVYIQQVMLFGPKSSPFVSQFVKNKTADKWQEMYPSAARALRDFTYMDDLLSSEPTSEMAIEVSTQCIEILKSINWDLIGFQSNSLEVLRALNKNHIKQDSIDIMTTEESTYTTKVLGVAWNPKTDSFEFNLNKNAFIKLVKDCGHKPTKRDQCSTIARIFDLMGLISHCIIRGRILLQRSWKKKLKWDDEISDEDHANWLKWLNDLERVSLLKIPRLRFTSYNITDASSLELHTFCDAGKEAFAAVSYLVATINNYRYVSFVMSKAKVAPIKIKTKTEITEMPRLEMLASLIAARLTKTIVELHKEVELEVFCWSDSEIVLNWLKNDNIKLPRFAVSPVEEVLELTTAANWKYVDSKNNAADIATKFQKFNFGDINSIWFQGPNFLRHPRTHWPKQDIKLNKNASLVANINQQSASSLVNTIKLPPVGCELLSDYVIDLLSAGITSRWAKLVRAVGRAIKFYYNAIIPLCKSKHWMNLEARQSIINNNNFEVLTGEERECAELFIIRRMQREAYPVEYEKLRRGKRISNVDLLQLNVFMDSNGVMRINSRVQCPNNSTNSYADSLAPLVPRKSMFSTALLFDIHYKYKHVGIEGQMAEFRAKYWMPQLRAALHKVKSMCNYCGYIRANPIEYKMAALPNVRVDASLKPFEVTGLDCAGPFFIYAKNGHQKKVWVLIMTCTLTRFIYLHILDNLTSLAVLEAIMVFWTSHGPVKQFISDNGTNFTGAANIIQNDARKIVQFLKDTQKELESELAEKSYASWTFIPVQSPWFGAFYERLIQTFKKSIASSIEGRKVSRIEFNIALQEAAHRINCRPLTHNPVSAEDEEVLTPHHLAKNRSGWPLLPSIHKYKEIPDPLGDRDQYRRGRKLADEVTRKFVSQYLPILTKRKKWFKNFAPIKAGDLVLAIDPNKTRKAWERARVLKVYYGRDNNGRVVDLMLPDGSIRKNRSVKRLAKIDIKSM